MKIILSISLFLAISTSVQAAAPAGNSELWVYGLPVGEGAQIAITTRCVNCRSVPGAGRLISVGVAGEARNADSLAESGVQLRRSTDNPLSFAIFIDPRAEAIFPLSIKFYGEQGKDFRLSYNSAAEFSSWRIAEEACESSSCGSEPVRSSREQLLAPISSVLGLIGVGALFFLRHRLSAGLHEGVAAR